MESEKPTGNGELLSKILFVVMTVVLLGLLIFLVRSALEISDYKQRIETILQLGDITASQAERLNALSKLVEQERPSTKDRNDLDVLNQIDKTIENSFRLLIEAANLIDQEVFEEARNLLKGLEKQIQDAESIFIDQFRKDRYIKNPKPHTNVWGFYCLQ